MIEKEKIFINTLVELKGRVEKLTLYDILKCSGLIRQLLVDSNCLLDQVNKKYRLDIRFRVQQRFKFPDYFDEKTGKKGKTLFSFVFIHPSESSTSVEFLKKDEFFKYELFNYQNEDFNVLDVIKICANKYGGVHFDKMKKEKEINLDIANSLLKFNDSSSIFHFLHGISKVCLEALEPLRKEIMKKNSWSPNQR